MAAKFLLPILLIISISLSLPAMAQSAEDKDGGGDSSAAYISATPTAAPGPAIDEPSDPAPAGDSYDPSLAAEPASSDGNSSSETPVVMAGFDPATAEVTPWRKDKLGSGGITSYDVPADKRPAVKVFIQSSMQVTEAKTDNFIHTVIEKRLADPHIGTFTKDCLKTCKEVYEDAKDAMKKTMEDVNEGNYYEANVDVTAISTDAETCKDCVETVYGQDKELDKFNQWVDGVIDKCLTMITGYSA